MREKKEKEELGYKVLKLIEEEPEITQRTLSKKLNISLGMINFLLKELVKKGLIKMENFKKSNNKLSYRYLLTPQGIKEKTRLTYHFLKRKMEEYERLREEIENLKREIKESPETVKKSYEKSY